MRTPSATSRTTRSQPARATWISRNGSALFLVLFFMGAVGTLALSAIYLTGNANLMSLSYDRESQLKYAAEAGIAMGKARINFDPAALPNTSYVALWQNATLLAADNQPINGISVSVYAGPTGSTTGQFGRFASVVAVAKDAQGAGFVRRLEMTQTSFAKYAYWSDSESNGGAPIYFSNGDQLWGPVWSNDVISIQSTGATFYDIVGTAKTVSGASYGTFEKGYQINQPPIKLPSTASLAGLSALATASGFNFTPPTTGDETTVLMRLEFVATDINGTGDSTAANDGFFRVYTANAGQAKWLRGDWPVATGVASPTQDSMYKTCGDFHQVTGSTELVFFPAMVHDSAWFRTLVRTGKIVETPATQDTLTTSALTPIMQHATARCFMGGDPHLVALERSAALGYAPAAWQKGGDDTTFTPTDPYGHWTVYSTSPDPSVSAKRVDANYLFPLYRGLNPNTKGVIYAGGTIAVSGVVGGQVTLYSPYTVVIPDDIRYANDAALGLCRDILGIIAGANVVVADNAINTPQRTTLFGGQRNLDDTKDLYLQAIIMALGTSFVVQNNTTGPTATNDCGSIINGRGCLYLTGGVIQANRGQVGQSNGTGFAKAYSYDRCAAVYPPPYFPTTGQFADNRYYELDPVNFSAAALFKALTPSG